MLNPNTYGYSYEIVDGTTCMKNHESLICKVQLISAQISN